MTEMDDDEITLTPEQADALCLDRNVAITAGAGSGKTFTLTERYLELLDANPDVVPENIVTITFTRKAAAELKTRVREGVYERLDRADADEHRWRDVLDTVDDGYIHTIHAFCARLLREHGVAAPVPFGFDVLDEEETADLQREVTREFLDTNQDMDEIELLARLWPYGQLVDVFVGLLNARPTATEWADYWQDRTVDEYLDVLESAVCTFDAETARDVLTARPVDGAIATIEELADTNLETAPDLAGLELLTELSNACTQLPQTVTDADEATCKRVVAALFHALQKADGDLYNSASYHVMGKKGDWKDETDAYADLKAAVNELLDALDPHATALQTMPGELERNSAHYVLALARAYGDLVDAYAQEKARQNCLDFPDLIETTIAFLETDETVRTEIHDTFDAVMVDEFQDTDPRQWRLVQLITGLEQDADNVFLVGDEKQSIYAFRGADVTTFATAREDLTVMNQAQDLDSVPDSLSGAASPTTLELSGNFRTLETPLTFLNEVFSQLFRAEGEIHRPDEARPQRLTFERDRAEAVADLEGSVEYLVVPSDADVAASLLGGSHPVAAGATEHAAEAEARALAARLTHLFAAPPQVYDPETDEHRAATPDDVAILLRRRTHLERYQRALDECDLPYTVLSGLGFYDRPEVRALVNLLRVMANSGDEIALYGVLRSPLFGFSDDRLARVATEADRLWDGLAETDDDQLADAYSLLTTWRRVSGARRTEAAVSTETESERETPLPWDRLLTRVIDETGYLMSVGAGERSQQAVANVEKFRTQVRGWCEAGVQTAASLLQRIDRQATIDAREGEAEIPAGTNGIQLMTIHAAKGLEFPIVVVPDLGSDLNYGRSIDGWGHVKLVEETADVPPLLAVYGPSPDDPYELESTVAHHYADERALPRERAEAKRLLYVACTRVRDHLLLCGTHDLAVDEGELTFGKTAAFDEATRWRDWLQPLLVDPASPADEDEDEDEDDAESDETEPSENEIATELREHGRTTAHLGDATYTVCFPPSPTTVDVRTRTASSTPTIEIPAPREQPAARRVTATNIVHAVAGDEGETPFDEVDAATGLRNRTDGTLPAGEFGTIVHQLAELRPPDETWPAVARRAAGFLGYELSETDAERVARHARDGITFVDRLEAEHSVEATADELSVTVHLGDDRIVGDIDHLTVTPDAYLITDYKTNDTDYRSPEELAAYYRPQMGCYALALHQNDPTREVCAHLRFTKPGVTKSFEWQPEEMATLQGKIKDVLASNW